MNVSSGLEQMEQLLWSFKNGYNSLVEENLKLKAELDQSNKDKKLVQEELDTLRTEYGGLKSEYSNIYNKWKALKAKIYQKKGMRPKSEQLKQKDSTERSGSSSVKSPAFKSSIGFGNAYEVPATMIINHGLDAPTDPSDVNSPVLALNRRLSQGSRSSVTPTRNLVRQANYVEVPETDELDDNDLENHNDNGNGTTNVPDKLYFDDTHKKKDAFKDKLSSYKFPEEGNRTKQNRKKMHGNDCPCCSGYFRAISGLVDSKALQQQVSKHRTVLPKSNTPAGFWNVGFDESVQNG
jgi:hypothetical protein